MSKLKVSLIAAGNGHDSPGAVGHQHIVGNPDGDFLIVDRIDGISPNENTTFVFIFGHPVNFSLARCLFHIGFNLGPLLGSGQFGHQRVFRGQNHKGCAPQRIGPGSEDGQFVSAHLSFEDNFGPFTASNPVFLHGVDPFRPV